MALNDSKTNPNEPDVPPSALAHAVETAARAAKIGDNVRKVLREIAEQYALAARQTFDPLTSQTLIVGAAPSSSPLLPFAETTVGSAVWNRATFVLKILTRQQRTALIAILSDDVRPLAKVFGDGLRDGPRNLILCAGAYFETVPDATAHLEEVLHQAIDALLGSAVAAPITTIHLYLQHRLAPVARAKHVRIGEAGSVLIGTAALIRDVQEDPCYPDFINEMPRLITDAAMCLYRALAPTLPARVAEDRRISATAGDAREVTQFLHLLYCQIHMVWDYLARFQDLPASELAMSCIGWAVMSATKALYMNFLQRRYPAMCKPPALDNEAAVLAHVNSYLCLQAIVDEVGQRLQNATTVPNAPLWLEQIRYLASMLIRPLTGLTGWIGNMIEGSGLYDLNRAVKRGSHDSRRALDSQPWLQATNIICSSEGRRVDEIEVISTGSYPNVGHGILSTHRLYESDEKGVFTRTFDCGAWAHAPNGDAVSDQFSFIPLAEVWGKEHLLSLVSERVLVLGDLAHASACALQRRFDWLETAQANGMPVRTVWFINEAADHMVVFNLFSQDEAERLKLGDHLVNMAEKYRYMYGVLRAICYELPRDARGEALPPEQLVMEILEDRDDDRGDDDEEVPPPAPAVHDRRTRRRIRGPVKAGGR